MAIEKTLISRILLRYDTYENWKSSTLILKAGEAAIASVPTGTTVDGIANPPAVLMKVGDGVHNFSELPWMQAVASDVYGWAKAASKPSYTADEISGLADYIAGEIQDTDTQYRIVKGADDYNWKLQSKGKGEADTAFTDVSTITIPDKTADITALQNLVGDTAVATQITNAITALNLADTYEQKGAAAAMKTAILGTATTAADTLGKLEALVKTAQETADSKATMAEVEAKDYSTKTEAQGYVDALKGDSEDTAEDMTVYGVKKYATGLNSDMDSRVKSLESAVGEGGSVAAQITAEINKLDNDGATVGTGEIISSVSQADGVIAVEKRALTAADIPELAISKITDLQTSLNAKQDTIAWQSDNYDAETNKAITKSDLDLAVAGLSGAVHFIGVKASLPETSKNGDIVIVDNKEYVYATADSKWHELGDETIYAVKGEIVDADIKDTAAIAQSKIAGLTDALNSKANTADLGTMAAETAADYVKKTDAPGYADILTATVAGTTYETKTDAGNKLAEAKSYADGLIADLDMAEVSAGEGSIIASITQADGAVTATTRKLVAADIPALAIEKVTGLQAALEAKANDADLAAIAKTGNVNDLIQTEGDVLIFDCGGAN